MDDERLILEVERIPLLFDPRHRFYKDGVKKEKAWSVVASSLNLDVDSCKTRWKSLRDTFVRYQNKKKSMSNGSGGTSLKEWKYSDIMSFLLPYIQPRSNKAGVETQDEERGSNATQTVEELAVEELLSAAANGSSWRQSHAPSAEPSPTAGEESPGPSTPLQQPHSQGKRTHLKSTAASLGEKLLGMLDEPAPKEPKPVDTDYEEAYHFGMNIVHVLYRMDRTNRRDAKIAILSTLREFEDKAQQHIHQPTPGPSTPVQQSQAPVHSQNGSYLQSANPPAW